MDFKQYQFFASVKSFKKDWESEIKEDCDSYEIEPMPSIFTSSRQGRNGQQSQVFISFKSVNAETFSKGKKS
jgi:hypothetical protein